MRTKFLFLFLLISSPFQVHANWLTKFLCCCRNVDAITPSVKRLDSLNDPDRVVMILPGPPSPASSDSAEETPRSTATAARRARSSAADYTPTFEKSLFLALRLAVQESNDSKAFRARLEHILSLIPSRRTALKDHESRLPGTTDAHEPDRLFDELPETAFHKTEKLYKDDWYRQRSAVAELKPQLRAFRKECTSRATINRDFSKQGNYIKTCIWYEATCRAYNECLRRAAALNMGRVQQPYGANPLDELYPMDSETISYLAGTKCARCQHADRFVDFKESCSHCGLNLVTPKPQFHMVQCQELYYLTLAVQVCTLMTHQLFEFLNSSND